MIRTPLGVDVPAASGGNYTSNLIFDVAGRAKHLRVDDIVEDRLGVRFSVLWWDTFPEDFTSGDTVALGGTTTPTQSLTTDDSVAFTSGQLDVRPSISIDGSTATVTDTGPTDGQLYESEVTASWTSASQGNAATTGDHLIDSTGKAYVITSISVPGSSQWASGVTVTELEKEGVTPQIGTAYLYSPTSNFAFYQGKVLNAIAEDTRRNRDEFTTDVVISGILIDVTNIATDLGLINSSGTEIVTQSDLPASGFVTNESLAASGFTTQEDIAASGFVGTHQLLSAEHTDTIAQVAISGGIVTALDGAWSQLTPGLEGSLLSVENGLPSYTDEIIVSSGGNITFGGDVTTSGDLTVLGGLNATVDLSASGFVTQDDIAASGFVGTHSLLSAEHPDTIAQVAVSGGIVTALDGAWSQLSPGLEGSLLSIENGLPSYTDEIIVSSGGNLTVGGDIITSGDLTVLGGFNATIDLSASGFVTQDDIAASGFTTQEDIAASGFVGTHNLLSVEHPDTIAQAATSGGIVAALDGAWSQLSPGLEGSLLSIENGLPSYTDEIIVSSGGNLTTGGDIVVSGDMTVLGGLNATIDLSASGFTTQEDIAASGFVGTHNLLSTEHPDTIAQAAISGGLVAALDGAWGQLSPGLEGSLLSIENGLPSYTDEILVSSGGNIVTGGDVTVSGDLTVLGDFNGTPDLTASGFVTQDDIAGSGFIEAHNLLSTEHPDTIAQVAVSGGIVAALDGAWSQLSPGLEGSLLSIENSLPSYTDEVIITPGGNITVGGDIVSSGDLTTAGNTLVSGNLTVLGDFNGTPDLTASGFTTQTDIAASGFVTTHQLLSSEHTDTIAQAAVSGGLVAALDGAWSQLSPGLEGSLLSIENGLPDYTDEITISSGGNLNVGGDTLVSGDLTVLGLLNATPDLTASGLIGVHELLSSEHTDTIAQAAISGGIVAALDGAWSQLSPGLEGNIIFVEAGLPAYNSNLTLLPDGSIDIGGNVLISGDLNVLGNFDGTPDLTASGFVVGPASATDNSLALYDGTTGELIKELTIGTDGFVLTVVSGAPVWAASSGGGGAGDITGPGSSTDNAIVRWDGVGGTEIQNSNVIIDDSGIIDLPAGVRQSITQGSGNAIVNVQNSDWLVRVDTQGQAVTVNLPPLPSDGQVHNIKDGNGNAANNNITITANTGQLIDPSALTLVMNLNYQSIEVIWVADPGIWHII